MRMELVYTLLSFTSKIPLLSVYSASVGARENRITVGGFQDSADVEGGGGFGGVHGTGCKRGRVRAAGGVMYYDVRRQLK